MRNVMAVDKGKIIGIPSAASGVSYPDSVIVYVAYEEEQDANK